MQRGELEMAGQLERALAVVAPCSTPCLSLAFREEVATDVTR